jgi:polar amino acid transport system ATP-binding protein
LAIIRLLTHRQSLTNVIVTHEIGFAMEVANRVCFLDRGRIVEQGNPRDVLSKPQDARTRQFLGLMSADRTIEPAAASASDSSR